MAGRLQGKVAMITGAGSVGAGWGNGRAAAVLFAQEGALVFGVDRNLASMEETAERIRESGGRFATAECDVTDAASVARAVEACQREFGRIDVLVNNVGGYWNTRHVTTDGLERTLAINHLAPFLLTSLLLPRLEQSGHARVVTVSSHAHGQGRIDFGDLQGERSYSGARAYNQSKLANILFSYELARRLPAQAVAANAVHPGVVSTAFGAEDPGRTQRLLVPFLRPFMKTPAQGAATSIHVASAPGLDGVTGRYFTNSQPRRSAQRSYDQATAARLWRMSAEMVGLEAVDNAGG
jgi:retinol dehydrogenase 14